MDKKISAKDILQLLAKKHEMDVFVPECRDGASQTRRHFRMDAWAMKKAWSRPLATAYEIKVSRNDFMRDDKWHVYMDYCNEFYFVCPSGMIAADELPDGVGLIYISKTGTRMFTKKKAKYRDVKIPDSVYRYILMSRVEITNETISGTTNAAYWEAWLNEKKENQVLSYKVSKRIRDIVGDVQRENKHLKQQMESYDAVKRRIVELGLDPDKAVSHWSVNREIDRVAGVVDWKFKNEIQSTIDGLQKIQQAINKTKEAA